MTVPALNRAMDAVRAAFPIAVISVMLLAVAVVTLVVKGDNSTLPDVAAPSTDPTTPVVGPTSEPPPLGAPSPSTSTGDASAAPTSEPTPAPSVTGGPDVSDQSDDVPDPVPGQSMPNTGGGAAAGVLLAALAAGRPMRRQSDPR